VKLPAGETHPERSLTVPIGEHVLNGRFDLLILSPDTAHIFDWKTGRPHSEAELRQDWQTRLYLAMLAEGGAALGHTLQPDQIAITYWYVNDPAEPRTIRYNLAWHKQNWADLQALVAQIDEALVQDTWPLTDDWSHCRQCAYQAYCGRQEAGETAPTESEEAADETDLFLEPEIP
jgi:RecB family exonuclease